MFGKELFIRFAASAFYKLLSVYVFSYFHFGFEGRMWDLIVSVPDHYSSFYFLVPWTHKSNRPIEELQDWPCRVAFSKLSTSFYGWTSY